MFNIAKMEVFWSRDKSTKSYWVSAYENVAGFSQLGVLDLGVLRGWILSIWCSVPESLIL